MTDKDNDSMATVQIKPDYAASEVYSTTSEPPPAYKRQANSVKIAKIVAFTVIVSSMIIGSFILASAYLQARASCDQVQALDSVLEKELMLETLQQISKEIPQPEALIGKDNGNGNDEDLQKLEAALKKEEQSTQDAESNRKKETNDDEPETDSSFSDSEEAYDLQKVNNKVPLELDLSDLAAALLQNNQKSRMNCVVERKHAEEIVDSPSRTVALPFGLNLTTDPKKARITGERIAIFCESGSENKERHNEEEQDAEPIVRQMFIPYQRIPIPFGATPNQVPLTHMPQRMMPQPAMFHQMPPPFQQLPMRPPMPPQVMQAPHPEPAHVRIQVQQIPIQQLPIREFNVGQEVPTQLTAVPNSQEGPRYQVQRVPLSLALQRAGITAEDLRNIQRMAEERISDELRRLGAEENSNSVEFENTSEEEDSTSSQMSHEQQHQYQQYQQQQQQQQEQQQEQQQQQQQQSREEQHQSQEQQQPQQQQEQQPPQPRDTMVPPMADQQQILQIGRGAYGRMASLSTPVRIPVPMMQAQADSMSQESVEPERPHYVQPRSIRSTDNIFKPETKRVKRCACDCNC